MSMAHGLEVRVPILDRRVMDLAGAIDISLLNPIAEGPAEIRPAQTGRAAGNAGLRRVVAQARLQRSDLPD